MSFSCRQDNTIRTLFRASTGGIALALALVSHQALARDTSNDLASAEQLDAITVTATRTAKSVLDVPATVSVITDDRIADTLVSDVRDLVRFEPGVSVRHAPSRFTATGSGNDARAGEEGFNIRGLDGNRVLIQVDGIRVPDAFSFGGQSVGRGDYVDLGLLKSVEILRGPASALYGSDGLAGAVSYTTNDPQDLLKDGKSLAGVARSSYDSANNQFTESGIVAGKSGNWSALVGYTRRDGNELKNKGANDRADITRTTPNPQTTGSNAVLGKIVWTPNSANRVRLTLDHLDDRVATNVLSAIALPPLAATSTIGTTANDTTKRDRVSLDWRYTGTGFISEAQVALYYQNGRSSQYSYQDRNTAVDRTRLNTFNNRVLGAAVDLHSTFTTGALTHKLVWGGDISTTNQKGFRDGTIPPAGETFPTRAFPETDYLRGGLFLADEISLANGVLTLYPAVRFDYYKLSAKLDPTIPTLTANGQSGSHVSPKIGGVLKLGSGISAFANYAQGFKAPAPSEVNQFFENPIQNYKTIPNANLKPETSSTIEGGLRFKTKEFALSATAYSGRYKNFISQELISGSFTAADPAIYQNINLNSVKIRGVEAQFEGHTRNGLTANFAISYTEGTINAGLVSQRPLLTVDPLKLVLGIGYRDPNERFGGQLIMTHSAAKEAGDATGGACGAVCILPASFTILDATAFVKVGKALTVRAGIFNLLDQKYAWWSDVRPLADNPTNRGIIDAYTQPGRNFSVSLTAKF